MNINININNMKKIAFKNIDGSISVIIPAPKEHIERNLGPLTDEQYKNHVMEKSIPQGATDIQEVTDSDLPIDRKFRDCLKEDGGKIFLDNEKLLLKTQDNKKAEINSFRDKLLNLDSPHTIGATYLLELNSEQVRFQVNQKTKTDLVANIIDLQDRIDAGEQSPTSDWIAVDNKTYQLTIGDFKTLIKHLKHRSECLYKNARAAKDAILAMDNVEDIEAYDINNITIYD